MILSIFSANIYKIGGIVLRSLPHVPNGMPCTRVQKVVTMPSASPVGRVALKGGVMGR